MKRWWLIVFCVSAFAATNDALSRMQDTRLSVAQRNDACFELRGDRTHEVVASMVRMLEDGTVRACAVRNLREANAGEELQQALLSDNPEVRAAAARELGSLQLPQALPLLARAAAEANVLVSSNAVRGLAQYTSPAVVPFLLEIAKQGGINGVAALERAAAFRDPGSLSVARHYLAGNDVASKVVAMQIIGDLGETADLLALREIAARHEKVSAKGRGFGLLPVVDLARAAENAIAAIQSRGAPESH